MAEVINANELDAAFGVGLTKPEDSDDYADAEDDIEDAVSAASDLLKRTAILLEYISDSVFCKNITVRERKAIGKHLTEIYKVTDDLDAITAELEGDDEE